MSKASQETQRFLVYVGTPDSFVSWPREEKISFYERVVAWHDYISRLQGQKHIEQAWGSQRIIGEASKPISNKSLMVAKYIATPDEFSQLITEDPLWNYGVYYAPMLKSMEGDYEDDLARYNRVRARLETRLNKKLPAPQIKFPETVPDFKPGGNLEFLVTMRNGPGYADLSDEDRLNIEERVLQFHDYHTQLRDRRIIVDDGACMPIWGFGLNKENVGMSGYWILRVNTYDEFSSLLLMDPLLPVMLHITVPLIPFKESRKRAGKELKTAIAHLR